jgi:hypothetical protein
MKDLHVFEKDDLDKIQKETHDFITGYEGLLEKLKITRRYGYYGDVESLKFQEYLDSDPHTEEVNKLKDALLSRIIHDKKNIESKRQEIKSLIDDIIHCQNVIDSIRTTDDLKTIFKIILERSID